MIMKYIAMVFLCLIGYGCTDNKQPAQQNSNAATEPQRTEKLQSVTAHTTENQQPPVSSSSSSTLGKWSQSGDPIDTKEFDSEITTAEKALKSKPADETAKKAMAEAFFKRGFALTEARQYASALGDYRRALKHDPTHEESKKWIDQIVLIYGALKKAYPKEGEEPPPLPYKKSEKGKE